MTREEMDQAAHQLLLQERRGQPLTYQLQQGTEQQQLQPWSGQTTTGIGYQPLEQPGGQPVYRPLHSSSSYRRGSNRQQQQQQQRQPPS